MSMAQLLGVWNSMPKTQAANLATENQRGAAQSLASMDKAVNSTTTQTTKQKSGGSFLGDLLPAVGGIVGSVIGGPAGGMIGSTLGGAAGSAMGGHNAAAIGGMGASLAGSAGKMLETDSPWSWKSSASQAQQPTSNSWAQVKLPTTNDYAYSQPDLGFKSYKPGWLK